MFYAAANMAVIGYNSHAVAFENKRKRDLFCNNTEFCAITAKEASNLEQFEMMRRYPDSILNARGYVQGCAMFTNDGNFVGIY